MHEDETLWRSMCFSKTPTCFGNSERGESYDDCRDSPWVPNLAPARYRVRRSITALSGDLITKLDSARVIDRVVQRLRDAGSVKSVVNHDAADNRMGNSCCPKWWDCPCWQGVSLHERIRPDP